MLEIQNGEMYIHDSIARWSMIFEQFKDDWTGAIAPEPKPYARLYLYRRVSTERKVRWKQYRENYTRYDSFFRV